MKINNIREFLLLAANKNFSKTAEQLYMSQSTLSRHITTVEEELGIQLINRSTSTFELTRAGQVAVDGFQKVLDEYHTTLNNLGALAGNASGKLRLGILYYDANMYVSRIRNVFRNHFPNVKLNLFSYQPEQAEQALMDGNVDAILIYDPMPSFGDGISVYPFLKTQLVVLFNQNHTFNNKDTILASDLDGKSLLSAPHPFRISGSRHLVTNILAENHAHPKLVIPVVNFDEVPELLKENNAVFISPMVNPDIYQGAVSYRPLEPERYHGQIAAVWKTENKSPLIHTLINAIKIAYS